MTDQQQTGTAGDQTVQIVQAQEGDHNDFFWGSWIIPDPQEPTPFQPEEVLPDIAPIPEDSSRTTEQSDPSPVQTVPVPSTEQIVAPEGISAQEPPQEMPITPAQDLHLDAIDAPDTDPKPSFSIHLDDEQEEASLPNLVLTQTNEQTIKELPDTFLQEEVLEPLQEEGEKIIKEPIEERRDEVKEEMEEEKEEMEEEILPIQKEISIQEDGEDKKDDENVLVRKFNELYEITQQVANFKQTTTWFDILGANNDKLEITYNFFVGDENYPLLLITKTELDKEDDEQDQHELSFYLNEEKTRLNITIDDTILFSQDTLDKNDIKTSMQITDKINKFQFLLNEELRKIEKQQQEKNAQEQERKKLQDVFRNF